MLWGVFFGVGGAYAGLQQEVMRSATRAAGAEGCSGLVPRAVLVGAPLSLLVLAFAWSLPDQTQLDPTAALGLMTGLLGLCVLTALAGVLGARGAWGTLAALLIADAALRGLGVAAAVMLGDGSDSALAWGIGAATFAWLPLSLSRHVRGAWSAEGTDKFGGLAVRGAAAMLASGSAALLVTGLPLLLALQTRQGLDERAGVLLAALVLVRSPVLVIVYGYRPVLMGMLLTGGGVTTVWRWWRVSLVVGGAAVAGAAFVGPTAIQVILGPDFSTSRFDVALLAAGAVSLVMLVLSGLALVADDRHAMATMGWLVALCATVLVLAWAPSAGTGLLLASSSGPTAGVAVHALALRRGGQSSPSENADSRSCLE
ncbi:hypothetical protein [Nocardioides ginsengisegetis]|uniref:hypothetical protein n=1 Tax=Nocardioides ginsengisegetis TaxID=661491 RepID=UPI0015FE5619|nr:hypothetical protein [Nocardioides ginsengisegetis]